MVPIAGFQQYPRMKYKDRQSLMRRANSTVHGPHLHFFPPPALSNEMSEQMADRLASNSQVSSSSSSNGTSKEGRQGPSTDSSAEPTRLVDRIAGSQSNGKVPANAALEDLSFATFGGVKGPAEVQQQGDAVPLLEASSSDETDSLSDESIPEAVSLSDDEASDAADSQKVAPPSLCSLAMCAAANWKLAKLLRLQFEVNSRLHFLCALTQRAVSEQEDHAQGGFEKVMISLFKMWRRKRQRSCEPRIPRPLRCTP